MLAILRQLQEEVQQVEEHASAAQSLSNHFVSPLESIASKFHNLDQLVEAVLDIEALPELRVNPQHDPVLQELSEEREGLEQRAQKIAQVLFPRTEETPMF